MKFRFINSIERRAHNKNIDVDKKSYNDAFLQVFINFLVFRFDCTAGINETGIILFLVAVSNLIKSNITIYCQKLRDVD